MCLARTLRFQHRARPSETRLKHSLRDIARTRRKIEASLDNVREGFTILRETFATCMKGNASTSVVEEFEQCFETSKAEITRLSADIIPKVKAQRAEVTTTDILSLLQPIQTTVKDIQDHASELVTLEEARTLDTICGSTGDREAGTTKSRVSAIENERTTLDKYIDLHVACDHKDSWEDHCTTNHTTTHSANTWSHEGTLY